MKTYNRICIKSHSITDQEGNTAEIIRGGEYTTSEVLDGNKVVVFGRFWAPFPAGLFVGEEMASDGKLKLG